MTFQKIIYTFFLGFLLTVTTIYAQTTPPNPTADRAWNQWWQDNSVADVEQEFNAARRNEESQRGLPIGILGNLDLPNDYLQRSNPEQALILVNAERQARHNVNYPNVGIVQGLPFEGVDLDLNAIAQAHAQDMLNTGNFSHTGSNGSSPFTRINTRFSGCTEGAGENIAWNSSGGFILSVPLAFYNFIYDDGACCNWGHRLLCLKQNINNNYGDPNRIGLVGFGRASGGNGDYFVMDYIDPRPSSSGCTYNVTDYGGGNTGCEEVLLVSGNITTNTYKADMEVQSDGIINSGQQVIFQGGESVVLMSGFHAKSNATFSAQIAPCDVALSVPNLAVSRTSSPQKHYFKAGEPMQENPNALLSELDLFIAPNPASQQTTISFELNTNEPVTVTLFDNLGRKIRDLSPGDVSVTGYIQFDLVTADLENGVYRISVNTVNQLVTKTLVVQHSY